VLANLNLDMVGEDLEKLHSKLILTDCPDSIPSVLDDLVGEMAEQVERLDVRTPRGSLGAFNWRRTPFSGGSDHVMLLDRKVPAVMFSHDPDYTHHTSEDTPDKVDPVELERGELIALFTLWHLANLDPEDEAGLALLAYRAASARVASGYARAKQHVLAASPDEHPRALAEAQVMLQHARETALHELENMRSFARGLAAIKLVQQLKTALKDQEQPLRFMLGEPGESLASLAHESDGRVPRRLTRGPLDFGLPESRLPAERADFWSNAGAALDGDRRFELVNLVDGLRDVGDIRNALLGQFGPLEPALVARYLEDLERVGAIEFAPR
jgi:hypothetical protein